MKVCYACEMHVTWYLQSVLFIWLENEVCYIQKPPFFGEKFCYDDLKCHGSLSGFFEQQGVFEFFIREENGVNCVDFPKWLSL